MPIQICKLNIFWRAFTTRRPFVLTFIELANNFDGHDPVPACGRSNRHVQIHLGVHASPRSRFASMPPSEFVSYSFPNYPSETRCHGDNYPLKTYIIRRQSWVMINLAFYEFLYEILLKEFAWVPQVHRNVASLKANSSNTVFSKCGIEILLKGLLVALEVNPAHEPDPSTRVYRLLYADELTRLAIRGFPNRSIYSWFRFGYHKWWVKNYPVIG